MKNVFFRTMGLTLLIASLAMVNATISVYAAQTDQNTTLNTRTATERQIEALTKTMNPTANVNGLSAYEAEAFVVGFAITQAMYTSADALDNRQLVPAASQILTTLVNLLKGRPLESPLREALEMVVSGKGTEVQLIELFDKAVTAYTAGLRGTEPWYFYTGMVVMQINDSVVYQDEAGLQSQLAILEELIARAPQSVPASLLNPMQAIARYAKQRDLREGDYLAIGKNIGSAVNAVLS